MIGFFALIITAAALFAGAAAGEEPAKLKLAACYSTPLAEPWPDCIHQACLKLSAEAPGLSYEMSENLGAADFEKVLRRYAERGFDIITGDSFGNEETARRVARDYPRTAFCFGSGQGPAQPNFAVFDNWIHEPAYLCGIIGARMSRSGIIGVLPQMDIPEANRIAHAYIAGARSAYPGIKVIGAYVGSFFDPSRNKEAGLALIEAGADVVFAMGSGGIAAAREKSSPGKPVYAFGHVLDQWEQAPDSVITGPVWDVYPTLKAALAAVRSGTFAGRDYREYSFMSRGGSSLAPYHTFETVLPAELKELVREKTRAILEGILPVPVEEGTVRFDSVRLKELPPHSHVDM